MVSVDLGDHMYSIKRSIISLIYWNEPSLEHVAYCDIHGLHGDSPLPP